MKPRYIFYGVIFCLLIFVLMLFIIQPGRYQKNVARSDTPTQLYQSYLSNWDTPNKAAFADCIMGYTDTEKLTKDQVELCVQKVNATK